MKQWLCNYCLRKNPEGYRYALTLILLGAILGRFGASVHAQTQTVGSFSGTITANLPRVVYDWVPPLPKNYDGGILVGSTAGCPDDGVDFSKPVVACIDGKVYRGTERWICDKGYRPAGLDVYAAWVNGVFTPKPTGCVAN